MEEKKQKEDEKRQKEEEKKREEDEKVGVLRAAPNISGSCAVRFLKYLVFAGQVSEPSKGSQMCHKPIFIPM